MYEQVKEVMQDEAFKAEIAHLVEHYHISASAQHTLTPRQDFIEKIVRATLEMRAQRAVS